MRKWAALVGIVGLGAAGCGEVPARGLPSAQEWPPASTATTAAAEGGGAPVLVRCEEGQRALVRHLPGDVSEVACVDQPASADEILLAAPPPARAVVTPAIHRTVVHEPYREPVRRPTRQAVRKTRPAKDSVAIIAGSTVAGAAIGGLVKGKKGALIGAVIGGGAGTIYDRSTRHKD